MKCFFNTTQGLLTWKLNNCRAKIKWPIYLYTTVPDTCEEFLGRIDRSLGGPRNGFWSCLHSWWHCQTLQDSSQRQGGIQKRWLLDSGSPCSKEGVKACWEALEVLLGIRMMKVLRRWTWLLCFGQIQSQYGQQRHYLRSRSMQRRCPFLVGLGKPGNV